MKDSIKEYAPITVRIGMSLVFLWFGISQITNTANFLGYLPQFLFGSKYAFSFVVANGVFEIIFGIFLAAGVFVRIAALILAVHLLGITIVLGYNEIAVRDFGLALATLSIFFSGEDNWCLTNLRKRL